MNQPTILEGRLCAVAAAVLWSQSGAFVKLLTQPNSTGLADPPVSGLFIAFYRTLAAGLVLLPTLRRSDISFRPMMLMMVFCFASMNILFVSALALGTSANAIILQYTAPLWMYLASIWWLGESVERRNTIALAIAMTGVAVIVVDAWQQQTLTAVLIALASGVFYAGVVLTLRILRTASSQWLTCLNLLGSAIVLIPVFWFFPNPRPGQIGFLIMFGVVQLAVPYWLISRSLKVLGPTEIGTITLIEPLLNPVLAYFVAEDVPATSTLIGAAIIMAALIWRYLPTKRPQP